jgi:hypothetical protein
MIAVLSRLRAQIMQCHHVSPHKLLTFWVAMIYLLNMGSQQRIQCVWHSGSGQPIRALRCGTPAPTTGAVPGQPCEHEQACVQG